MTLFLDIYGAEVSEVYFCLEEMRREFDLINNVIKTNKCNTEAVNELIKNNSRIEPTTIRLIENTNLDKLKLDFGFCNGSGTKHHSHIIAGYQKDCIDKSVHIWLRFSVDSYDDDFHLVWDLRNLMLRKIEKINNIIYDANKTSSSNVKAADKIKVIEKLKKEQIHPTFINMIEEIGHAKVYFHFHSLVLAD